LNEMKIIVCLVNSDYLFTIRQKGNSLRFSFIEFSS